MDLGKREERLAGSFRLKEIRKLSRVIISKDREMKQLARGQGETA